MPPGRLAPSRLLWWAAWPLWFYLVKRTRRHRVLVTARGRVLLVRPWLSDGRLGLPGGGQGRRESSRTSVCREAQEETGIQLKPAQLRPLGRLNCQYRGLRFSFSGWFYALSSPRRPAARRGREIAWAGWVPIDELATLPLDSAAEAVLAAARRAKLL